MVTAAPRRTRVAPNDAVWLQDSPTNLMVINAVYTTDRIGLDAVRDLFLRKVVCADGGRTYPRFTWRVVKVRGHYYWEPDPQFDVERHIVVAPEGVGTTAALQDYVGAVADHPLPPDRPLWQIQHVEDFEDGGSAFIIRIHHCMADGIAMVPILFLLMDERERLEAAGRLPPRTVGTRLSTFQTLVTAPLMGPLILARRLAWRADRHALHGARISGRKRVAWTVPLDLAVIKKVKDELGATVNDVLMATVSGGLARYLVQVEAPAVPRIRISMPVNVRRPDEPLLMENKFAAVLLDLPIGAHTALERIRTIKARMDHLKASVEPLVLYGVVNILLSTLPHGVSRTLIDFLANKCTAVVTNVPGPPGEVFLAGRRVRSLMFWVPQRAGIGVGVSILTFGGKLQIGVIADRELVADPSVVTRAFEEEFEALRVEHGL